jgi:electron transport complex protein RnfG
MSAVDTIPSAPRGASVGAMYRALVGIAAGCGLLIVTVFLVTAPIIRDNRAAQLEAAVFAVVPGAVSKASFRYVDGEGLLPADDGSDPASSVHAAYDANGALLGVAIPGRAMGYADFIHALYGYDPDSETVVGLQVLASKETPGLGDKIEKDPNFVANFTALDLRLDASGTALAHPPVAVANGTREQPVGDRRHHRCDDLLQGDRRPAARLRGPVAAEVAPAARGAGAGPDAGRLRR